MTRRAAGRPWTAHEDHLLATAVAAHGQVDNWKAVALAVPGRTNKACRKASRHRSQSRARSHPEQRWLHSLSPSVKKSAWSKEEDALLLDLYQIHAARWAVIARHIPGRTDDACSKRYREALDPSLKKHDWTPDEDERLVAAFCRLGGKWGRVGQELQRSGLGCRNRFVLSAAITTPSQPSPQVEAPRAKASHRLAQVRPPRRALAGSPNDRLLRLAAPPRLALGPPHIPRPRRYLPWRSTAAASSPSFRQLLRSVPLCLFVTQLRPVPSTACLPV